MRSSIRVGIVTMIMAASGGCAVDAPPADLGETSGAGGATYECLDLCPPPERGMPGDAGQCHHVCVLNYDPPTIGGSATPSICSGIHQLKCGDRCCDSQEAGHFEAGQLIRSSCPSDCLVEKIGATLNEDGRLHVSAGTRSIATFIGELLVNEPTCE